MEKDYIYVGMSDIKASDDDNNVIGTTGLGPCFGVVLYNEDKKRAIVTHSVSDNPDLFFELILFADKNELLNDNMKYAIIPGYDETTSYKKSKETLEIEFEKSGIKPLLNAGNCVRTVKISNIYSNEYCNEFLFDAFSGRFVTYDYDSIINNDSIKK